MRYNNIPLYYDNGKFHERLSDISGNTHKDLIENAKQYIKSIGKKGKFYYQHRGWDKKFTV